MSGPSDGDLVSILYTDLHTSMINWTCSWIAGFFPVWPAEVYAIQRVAAHDFQKRPFDASPEAARLVIPWNAYLSSG